MKKLIFRAPVQTASGYGVYARQILKMLVDTGKFDITVMSVPWGVTPLIYREDGFWKTIRDLAGKFNPQKPEEYDLSVQVTIPNEFHKMAPVNIGFTAGIEVDRVAPEWIKACNDNMDLVVVPSYHSARVFTTTIYTDEKDGSQVKIKTPIYTLPAWIDTRFFNPDPLPAEHQHMQFETKSNFLAVGLGFDKGDGLDRKNFSTLVKWFCEQFAGNEDVGLVLKVSMVNNSPVDFNFVKHRIDTIKAATRCGPYPKITLLHGRMSEGELAALYKNPSIKAYVSLAHGEGFGLPIAEAAACGLPVIATDWSGHLDFLEIGGKKKFVPLDFKLAPIDPQNVWVGVMPAGSQWAFPSEEDTKRKLTKVLISPDRPRQWAAELATHITKTYTQENLQQDFLSRLDFFLAKEPVAMARHALYQPKPSSKTLDTVTLVAVSTNNVEKTLKALKKTQEQIAFAKVKFFTDRDSIEGLPDDIELVKVPTFTSVNEHDDWFMKELPKHIDTPHYLSVQWDGYVLNGSAWEDSWLQYDYIGAPWFWNGKVGNGAMCLRSKKFGDELTQSQYVGTNGWDFMICGEYREKLELAGLKFAPYDVARKFSVENEPYRNEFGWHGKSPFCGEE